MPHFCPPLPPLPPPAALTIPALLPNHAQVYSHPVEFAIANVLAFELGPI